MTRHVALLRGINLGARNKILMADLRRLFADLGYGDVETYLQSGNVVFTSEAKDPSRLARDVERRIAHDLDLDVTVLVRTGVDLARLAEKNPFLSREQDLAKLHLTFLADTPEQKRVTGLEKPTGESAEFSLDGREVYLHCPEGYGRTRLNNAFFERRLGVAATTRNWKTVTALRDLTRE
jgi:uncharacterized protein (DUF1697 family)